MFASLRSALFAPLFSFAVSRTPFNFEFIDMQPYSDGISLGLFVTPSDMLLTPFRMRVRNIFSENGDIDPCGVYAGEVEDYTVVIDEGSNVEEVKDLAFKVYPNPSSGLFVIETDKAYNHQQINIYNSLGHLVYSNQMVQSKMEINTLGWSTGVYYITVFDEDLNRSIYKKLIIR